MAECDFKLWQHMLSEHTLRENMGRSMEGLLSMVVKADKESVHYYEGIVLGVFYGTTLFGYFEGCHDSLVKQYLMGLLREKGMRRYNAEVIRMINAEE